MQNSKPMDRLICGDVGYGKTEIAFRAAFKAVMNDKQVAMLVPTTVLAQQHFNNLSKRLRDFPFEIRMLSRFNTAKEIKETIEGLKKGTVNIVIGTHRLLSKDVKFKELGLVIVDEEQRFGVRHKEKLKTFRLLVDVLTLTATPIPRTLYMSLAGVKDLSIINTPPQSRLPVKTYVLAYDDELIRHVVLEEIKRGGQVYFVHNRVFEIEILKARLEKLIPEALIGCAHGQMPEEELEKTMVEFINGDFDMLLCTNIVESGLDIPNVNTIIINRADRFGLSDLYQLRGRVGRLNRQAYCYLLLPLDKAIDAKAKKRLNVISKFTELGSGFKIAMEDLEIRGAGNLLGQQQHGYISLIGFDLYCRLLKNSINKLAKNNNFQENNEFIKKHLN
jgi:transcription-repair coupling factor (superfamily II helicase)